MNRPSIGPRRFILSFAAALLCGLAVFTLPRTIYGSVSRVLAQQVPPRDTVHQAPPATIAPTVQPQAPARAPMPVTLPMRLIGLVGMALLLLVGWALSRDRRAV